MSWYWPTGLWACTVVSISIYATDLKESEELKCQANQEKNLGHSGWGKVGEKHESHTYRAIVREPPGLI